MIVEHLQLLVLGNSLPQTSSHRHHPLHDYHLHLRAYHHVQLHYPLNQVWHTYHLLLLLYIVGNPQLRDLHRVEPKQMTETEIDSAKKTAVMRRIVLAEIRISNPHTQRENGIEGKDRQVKEKNLIGMVIPTRLPLLVCKTRKYRKEVLRLRFHLPMVR